MKKTTRRIARTSAALAAALALAAPMTVQPVAEIGTIIAYAAAPTSTDLTNDIAAHPENFFQVHVFNISVNNFYLMPVLLKI